MHIAIIGCGQLARMLALAGIPMGLQFSFIADKGESTDTRCVDGLGTVVYWTPDASAESLFQQSGKPDIITVEKEQIDSHILQALNNSYAVYPNIDSIEMTKDRYKERCLLNRLEIPVAEYSFGEGVEAAASQLGYPLVLKSIAEGYDGKNQWVIKSPQQLQQLLASGALDESTILSEKWINFDRELSLIGVRGRDAQISFYPLIENVHRDGILCRSIAPAADLTPALVGKAQDYLARIMHSLDYVGVMAMECFATPDELIVNELAPRVHNSGHWTQLGSVTCQFENHLRAIAGLPLGSTRCHGVAGMLNLLGNARPPMDAIGDSSKLYWYNKESRPGRKQGHVNFLESSREQLHLNMQKFEQKLSLTNGTNGTNGVRVVENAVQRA